LRQRNWSYIQRLGHFNLERNWNEAKSTFIVKKQVTQSLRNLEKAKEARIIRDHAFKVKCVDILNL
jgi:hypothetical protein